MDTEISSKSQNKLIIRHDKDIPAEDVRQICISVGWQSRSAEDIKKALKKSILVTSAWLDDRLIGFARATGDGVFSVTIWDVAVKKDFQRQGIGKKLLNSMLTKLYDYGIPLITLYSELDKINFYSKLGFNAYSKNIVSMYKSNK